MFIRYNVAFEYMCNDQFRVTGLAVVSDIYYFFVRNVQNPLYYLKMFNLLSSASYPAELWNMRSYSFYPPALVPVNHSFLIPPSPYTFQGLVTTILFSTSMKSTF